MAEFRPLFYNFFPSKDEEEACKVNNTPWIVTSMSNQKPLMSTNKTFFFNFFPSKDEEEASGYNNTPRIVIRELIEIRDVYPAPIINLENPWQIKKKITHEEVAQGILVIPFFEAFEYILRYWRMDMAQKLLIGYTVSIGVCDVTEGNDPKKYRDTSIFFKKQPNDDYSLKCIQLFNYRRLSVGDEIGLYWDPRSSSFTFKLLSKVRNSRSRTKK